VSARKNPHAVALGRRRSPARAAASRVNGELGGRPRLNRYAVKRIPAIELALPGEALEAAGVCWFVIDREGQRKPQAAATWRAALAMAARLNGAAAERAR
jgi:hypothetical protein